MGKNTENNGNNEGLLEIAIENINVKQNVRSSDWTEDEIKALADNIKLVGLLQPPLLQECKGGDGRFDVIDGIGRIKAMILLKKKTVDCIIIDPLGKTDKLLAGVSANTARKAMGRSELLKIQNVLKKGGKSDSDIAKATGLGKSTVRLYDQLERRLRPIFGDGLDTLIEIVPLNDLRALAQSPEQTQKAVAKAVTKPLEIAKKNKRSGSQSRKAGRKTAANTAASEATNLVKQGVAKDKPKTEPKADDGKKVLAQTLINTLSAKLRKDFRSYEALLKTSKDAQKNRVMIHRQAYILEIDDILKLGLRADKPKA